MSRVSQLSIGIALVLLLINPLLADCATPASDTTTPENTPPLKIKVKNNTDRDLDIFINHEGDESLFARVEPTKEVIRHVEVGASVVLTMDGEGSNDSGWLDNILRPTHDDGGKFHFSFVAGIEQEEARTITINQHEDGFEIDEKITQGDKPDPGDNQPTSHREAGRIFLEFSNLTDQEIELSMMLPLDIFNYLLKPGEEYQIKLYRNNEVRYRCGAQETNKLLFGEIGAGAELMSQARFAPLGEYDEYARKIMFSESQGTLMVDEEIEFRPPANKQKGGTHEQ